MSTMGLATSTEPANSPPAPAPGAALDDPSLETVLEVPAILLFWDRSLQAYGEEGTVAARIIKLKDEPFHYFLTASDAENGQMLAHRVASNLMARWHAPMWALSWNHVSDAGDQNSWCLRFQSQEGFDQFQEEYTKKLWETLNETPWEKIKVCCISARVAVRHHLLFFSRTNDVTC